MGCIFWNYPPSFLLRRSADYWGRLIGFSLIAFGFVSLAGAGYVFFAGEETQRPIAPPITTAPLPLTPTPGITATAMIIEDLQVSGPYEGTDVIYAIGFVAETTDSLRLLIDQHNELVRADETKFIVARIPDIIRGTRLKVPILYWRPSAGDQKYFWGSGIDHPLHVGLSHICLTVVGQKNVEQSYGFFIYLSRQVVQITPSTREDNPEFLVRSDTYKCN